MSFNWWLLVLYLTKGGDFATTEYGLSRGLEEANPLMRARSMRIATLAVGPPLVLWSTERLHRRRPKLALALRIGVVVLWSYATIHNLDAARGR